MKPAVSRLFVCTLSALSIVLVPARAQMPQDATALKAARTDLHRAAASGNVNELHSALKRGAQPDARDAAGRTALITAAAAGHTPIIRALIEAGADVNASTASGTTPLLEAARRGSIESVRLLVRAGADVNRGSRGWGTPLEAAECAGYAQIVELLRDSGAHTSGKSVGDTVCVRPWGGDGYCGVVRSFNNAEYEILVTEIIGCHNGCAPRRECSAGRTVGGRIGVHAGDTIRTVSECLTDTGVKR